MRVPASVRRVTDPLLRDIRVPIVSGVNRGRWWSLVSAGSGYASGRRAAPQMHILAALIRPADIVWDVGAHHGFVTLCAARRAGPAGAVHAFEPSRSNQQALRRHVRWNHLRNVVVHPFALSRTDGEESFGGSETSKMYSLGGGSESVVVRRGASIVDEGMCPAPTFMKVDVEGAEADAIEGTLPVLPRSARLLIAMHGPEADERSCALLEAAGFELVPSRELVKSRSGRWRADPDLFCIGPESPGREQDLELLRASGF